MALAGVAAAETLTFDISRSNDAVTFDFATDVSEILTMTYTDYTFVYGGTNTTGGWQTPENKNYEDTFSPNVQLRKDQDDSWTMNFTITNNCDNAITLTQFTFDGYVINGGGSDKNTEVPATLTLGEYASSGEVRFENYGSTATATLNLTGDNLIEIGAGKSVTLALTMSGVKENNTYSGLTGGSVTYSVVPEPTTATLSLLALAGLAARRRRK